MPTPPVALTIAGSDSGGGAGIQADLRTFAAHGVHGAVAVTAVTAQNTTEVRGVTVLAPSMVTLQVLAVTDDLAVAATKTGMLASADIVTAVAELAAAGRLPQLVVDPVLVSSTGHPLMDEGGLEAYRRDLLPRALVATPNLREAAVLTGQSLQDLGTVDAMAAAAGALRDLGTRYVVVKGGHFDLAGGEGAPDVLAGPDGVQVLDGDRVATGNDHGTGCSLSAAVAAALATGHDVPDAVRRAKAFVRRALAGGASWRLGQGHGPVDHFGWSAGTAEPGDGAPGAAS